MLKVMIDAGHGGTDRWNKGPTGYVEADGVLKIAKYLRDELLKTGTFEVKLTRETDVFVGVRERGAMAAQWGADLLISEHTNATGTATKASGTCVYESVDLDDNAFAARMSYAIATVLGIPNLGNREWESDDEAGEDYLGLIDEAQDGGVPHVMLIESAFHDNPKDEALLKDDNMLRKIAKAQAEVICNYFAVLSPISRGSFNGFAVECMKKKLQAQGYGVVVNGDFDVATEAIIKQFQTASGLTADGIVGPKTWEKLYGFSVIPDSNPTVPSKPIMKDIAKTPIMGKEIVDVLQMDYFVRQVNPDAPCLSALYYYFGITEGVRADVAFAQSIYETNYFRFTGTVTPDQNNFAGIGTTSSTNKGHYFSTPAEGILAQIQHLKAYASTEDLILNTTDPRFSLVTRGIAPCVEDLGGKWAVPGYDKAKYSGFEEAWNADATYGQRIANLVMKMAEVVVPNDYKLALYPVPVEIELEPVDSSVMLGTSVAIKAKGVNTDHMVAVINEVGQEVQKGTEYKLVFVPQELGVYTVIVKGRNAVDGALGSTTAESKEITFAVVPIPKVEPTPEPSTEEKIDGGLVNRVLRKLLEFLEKFMGKF